MREVDPALVEIAHTYLKKQAWPGKQDKRFIPMTLENIGFSRQDARAAMRALAGRKRIEVEEMTWCTECDAQLSASGVREGQIYCDCCEDFVEHDPGTDFPAVVVKAPSINRKRAANLLVTRLEALGEEGVSALLEAARRLERKDD